MTQNPKQHGSEPHCKFQFALSLGFPLRFAHVKWLFKRLAWLLTIVIVSLLLVWKVGFAEAADIAFRWLTPPAIAHLLPPGGKGEAATPPAPPPAPQVRPSRPAKSQPRLAAPAKSRHQQKQKQKRNCRR